MLFPEKRDKSERYPAALMEAVRSIIAAGKLRECMRDIIKLTGIKFLALGEQDKESVIFYYSTYPELLQVTGSNPLIKKMWLKNGLQKKDLYEVFANLLPKETIETIEYNKKIKSSYLIIFRNQVFVIGTEAPLSTQTIHFLETVLELIYTRRQMPSQEKQDLQFFNDFIDNNATCPSTFQLMERAISAIKTYASVEGIICFFSYPERKETSLFKPPLTLKDADFLALEKFQPSITKPMVFLSKEIPGNPAGKTGKIYAWPLQGNAERIGTVYILSNIELSRANINVISMFMRKLVPVLTALLKVDIAEKTRADAQLEYERIDSLNREKETLLSMVSHELRTPATIIRNAIALIMELPIEIENQSFKEKLMMINEAADRELFIITSLLEASRINRAQMELFYQKVNIETLIDTAAKELKLEALKKGLTLEYIKHDTPIPEMDADRTRLREVIDNLIINAIKYTNHGGIQVESFKEETSIRIVIRDTGKGIPEKLQINLFKMFQRISSDEMHPDSTQGGLGLGLYITKNIIDAHHGTIEVQSVLNQGTVFTIHLPLRST